MKKINHIPETLILMRKDKSRNFRIQIHNLLMQKSVNNIKQMRNAASYEFVCKKPKKHVHLSDADRALSFFWGACTVILRNK